MKYTEEHVWMLEEDEVIVVGITALAAEQLGEIVFVDLPEIGAEVTKDDEIVVIESAEAALDVLSPLDGEIVEVNDALTDSPGTVSEDPEGDGWLFRIEPSDPSQLADYMGEAAYAKFIA